MRVLRFEGLSALLDTVDGIREQANPQLKIEGLLRTMYDPRNGLHSGCFATTDPLFW